MILGGPGEVGARTEVLSLRAQHDRPAFEVVVQALVGVGDALDQRGVKVVVRGPMDLHHGHVAGEFDRDIRTGHNCSSSSRTAALNVSGWSMFAACPALSMTTLRELEMRRCM